MSENRANTAQESRVPLVRCGLGGVLMGLANLVPGISGGTMLVACGIYTLFIDAVSDATRLRFSKKTIMVLGAVVLGAVIAIGGLASSIHWALVNHRWMMFSVFIGLRGVCALGDGWFDGRRGRSGERDDFAWSIGGILIAFARVV